MLALTAAGILAFLLAADALIEQRPFATRAFWAMFDGVVHGILALLVTSPIIAAVGNGGRTVGAFLLMLFAGTLIDLDHFVVSRSFNLRDALHRETRPPIHSFTFAALVGLLTFAVSSSAALGWGTFAAVSSHVLRDASMGTAPILWPL